MARKQQQQYVTGSVLIDVKHFLDSASCNLCLPLTKTENILPNGQWAKQDRMMKKPGGRKFRWTVPFKGMDDFLNMLPAIQ